ncbi:MAG: hypothetical protein IPL53_16595 [Ignavibacteria bacterium]|nr:hypothetical protein [Ignavibacteria bacterium]
MNNQILLRTFVVLLFNMFFLSAYAQSFKWVKHQSVDIQFNPDLTSVVCETDVQGNCIFSSIKNYKISFSVYYGDVSLKKFSSSGLLLFNKTFFGKLTIDDIQTDINGNIYISGSFMDTLQIDPENFLLNTGSGLNVNYFLIKISQNGDFVWKKNINADFPGNFSLEVVKIKGKNLFAGILNLTEGYIKKYDLDGYEQLTISQSPVRGISGIDVDESGNIYAGGSCSNENINFGGHTTSSSFFYNVYFVKYNSSGNYQWSRFVEDITFSSIDIACDNSGNLFAAGNLFGDFMFGNIQAQGNQWIYDFFLTKLDESGNFLWVREVPNTPTITGDARKGKVSAIAVDQDNNVYIAGFLRSTVNWGNNIITSSNGSSDILILKYDPDGNILMGKRAGGTSSDWVDDLSLDNSGNVFVSGNFSSSAVFDSITVSGKGNINSYLAKLQMSGILDLSLIVEGFYDQSEDNMRIQDTVTLFLRNSVSPYSIADSSQALIDPVTFTGSFSLSNAVSGSYYIQTKHRNSLETWSAFPVIYAMGGNSEYDFTLSQYLAFGNNLKQVNSSPYKFAMYSGDVNQDGYIDLSDIVRISNDAADFIDGYVNSDVNGDEITDLSDIIITVNNSNKFVSVIRP